MNSYMNVEANTAHARSQPIASRWIIAACLSAALRDTPFQQSSFLVPFVGQRLAATQ
jgi:hypothetical protein